MGVASYLKRLPVPALLGGGLYAGYTGDIPFVGASMDALLTEIDVSIFEGVKYPIIFVVFTGLTAAWLIYLFVSLVVWGRRHRALIKLGEILVDGVDFRGEVSGRNPPLTTNDRAKISDFEKAIVINVGVVSRPEQNRFKRVNTYDEKDHPPEVQMNVRGGTELIAFSELLKRVGDFIDKYKGPK